MNGRPMLVEEEFKVNGYDIDVMGIVNNIVYLRWFENLRHKFLDIYCPFEELYRKRQSPILSKTEVEYKYPITIFDKPIGRVWVSELRRGRWEVSFEIESAGKINCIGRQSGYFIDLDRKKPIPVPDVLKEHYEKINP